MSSQSPNPGGQTTLLSTISEPEFSDLVRRNWTIVQNTIDRNAKEMFVMDKIGSGNGSSKLYNEYDTDTYSRFKPEGAAMSKASVGVGYNRIMTPTTMARQIDVTLEDRVMNRYMEVQSKLTSLSGFFENRLDLDLSHVITFASSTSFTDMDGQTIDNTTGDGLALASAVHTLAFSSTTYSNVVSGAPQFSQTALQAALLVADYQILNNFGQRRQMNFNVIWCAQDPTTEQAIDQLIFSTADVDAVQAGIINTYRGKFRRVTLPNVATTADGSGDLTKRKFWGVAAVGQGLEGWQGILGMWMPNQLKTPTPGNNGEDIDTLDWTYATVGIYGIAPVSPRGFIISLATVS